MRSDVRRIIEMSKRVLSFSVAHPDPSEGYAAALARLKKAVEEADVLADRQQNGINAARQATGVKRALRRKIRRTQLLHLARVAESAGAEVPELTQKFRLVREAVPYLAFRTAARGMLAEAQNQKALLIRHGLLEQVLQGLAENLDKFDAAVEQGTEARRAHVGASAELDALAEELTQVIRLKDSINRSRFFEDPESLAQWQSASNVIGPPRASGAGTRSRVDGKRGSQSVPPAAPPGAEIKPAA
jgi:hypothetical protein